MRRTEPCQWEAVERTCGKLTSNLFGDFIPNTAAKYRQRNIYSIHFILSKIDLTLSMRARASGHVGWVRNQPVLVRCAE